VGWLALGGAVLLSMIRSNRGRAAFITLVAAWSLVALMGVAVASLTGLAGGLGAVVKPGDYVVLSGEPCEGCVKAPVYECIVRDRYGQFVAIAALVRGDEALVYTSVPAHSLRMMRGSTITCGGGEALVVSAEQLSPGIYWVSVAGRLSEGKPIGYVWVKKVPKSLIYSEAVMVLTNSLAKALALTMLPGLLASSLFTGVSAFYVVRGVCDTLVSGHESGASRYTCITALVYASAIYALLVIAASHSLAILVAHIAIWVASSLSAGYAAVPPRLPSLAESLLVLGAATASASMGGLVGGTRCCSEPTPR